MKNKLNKLFKIFKQIENMNGSTGWDQIESFYYFFLNNELIKCCELLYGLFAENKNINPTTFGFTLTELRNITNGISTLYLFENNVPTLLATIERNGKHKKSGTIEVEKTIISKEKTVEYVDDVIVDEVENEDFSDDTDDDFVDDFIDSEEFITNNTNHINLKSNIPFEYLPNWFKDAKTKNAIVTLDSNINNGLLLWKNGIWKNGTWQYGTWEDGIWENGTWQYGTWENGTCEYCNWENGTWENGTWEDGNWKDGTWKDGTWEDGIWENGTWKDGLWEDGIWENGTWKDGTWKDGLFEKGTWENGIWEDGTWENGIWEDGTWEGGLRISVQYPLNDTDIENIDIDDFLSTEEMDSIKKYIETNESFIIDEFVEFDIDDELVTSLDSNKKIIYSIYLFLNKKGSSYSDYINNVIFDSEILVEINDSTLVFKSANYDNSEIDDVLPDFTIDGIIPKSIENIDIAKEFVIYLSKVCNLSFHPDDDFSEYINDETNLPLFTENQISIYNKYLDDMYELDYVSFGYSDIYDFCYSIIGDNVKKVLDFLNQTKNEKANKFYLLFAKPQLIIDDITENKIVQTINNIGEDIFEVVRIEIDEYNNWKFYSAQIIDGNYIEDESSAHYDIETNSFTNVEGEFAFRAELESEDIFGLKSFYLNNLDFDESELEDDNKILFDINLNNIIYQVKLIRDENDDNKYLLEFYQNQGVEFNSNSNFIGDCEITYDESTDSIESIDWSDYDSSSNGYANIIDPNDELFENEDLFDAIQKLELNK